MFGQWDDKEKRMRELLVFNSVTVDGYFTDQNGDMSWAHKQDDRSGMHSPPRTQSREVNCSSAGLHMT